MDRFQSDCPLRPWSETGDALACPGERVKVQPRDIPVLANSEVQCMVDEEKLKKAEQVAEKTGEAVGKGLKKGFGIVKALGKGAKDAVENKKKE